jgi:hypothetical protein
VEQLFLDDYLSWLLSLSRLFYMEFIRIPRGNKKFGCARRIFEDQRTPLLFDQISDRGFDKMANVA